MEAVLDDAETRAGGDVPQPQRAVPAGGRAVRPAEAHTADLRTALRTSASKSCIQIASEGS